MFEPNDELKVTLTASEWNNVMMVLNDGIYRIVAPLIAKINAQCQGQMQPEGARPNGPALTPEQLVQ